jgi:two-component system nitrogen regulation response regulator GlnG
MLTRHFLQQSAKQLGVEPKRISDAALAWLENFAFPGNVRQLENLCHWLTVMAPAQVIEPKDLPPEIGVQGDAVPAQPAALAPVSLAAPDDAQEAEVPLPSLAALPAAPVGSVPRTWEIQLEQEANDLLAQGRTDVWDVLTRRFESSLIQTALHATRGRRIEAAHKLGIGRNTITRKIQELGLEE